MSMLYVHHATLDIHGGGALLVTAPAVAPNERSARVPRFPTSPLSVHHLLNYDEQNPSAGRVFAARTRLHPKDDSLAMHTEQYSPTQPLAKFGTYTPDGGGA